MLPVAKWVFVKREDIESTEALVSTVGSPRLMVISLVKTNGLFVGYLHVPLYTSGAFTEMTERGPQRDDIIRTVGLASQNQRRKAGREVQS